MEVSHFDICSGALICDVMHDLFEGILQNETKLIDRNYFTLKTLNSNIESLELPVGTESDKPVLIDCTQIQAD